MYKRLDDFCDIFYGKSPKGHAIIDGTVPIIGTGGTYGFSNTAIFFGPAIVVPRKGSLGSPHYVDSPFWASDTTYALIPKSGVSAAWLYYQLCRFNLERLNEATGVPSISREWLAKIQIPDHKPEVQEIIACILQSADAEISIARDLVQKREKLKVALMQDLLSGKVSVAPLIEGAA